jgi:two-component sensor histidine kinase
VRQPAEAALTSVAELQRRILVWGAAVVLVVAAFGWFMAGVVVQPLRALTRAAEALGKGEPVGAVEAGPREIGRVAAALSFASQEITDKTQRQTLLIHELNHRVKNTLATIQSIAALTARSAPDKDSYRQGLEGRILALSKTHDLLTSVSWETVSLRDLFANELEPFANGSHDRIRRQVRRSP